MKLLTKVLMEPIIWAIALGASGVYTKSLFLIFMSFIAGMFAIVKAENTDSYDMDK